MNLTTGIVVGCLSIAGAGFTANEYLNDTFSKREAVVLAGAKADFVLDRQISSVAAEIGYLERKPNKTSADVEQLRWLRQQLDEMRRVRSGK